MAFLSDAALGSGVSELLKVVIHFAKQTKNFRPNLKTLQKTLESVKPTFDNIGKLHKLLDRPQQDTDQFIKKLQSGVELVKKCSAIPCWNVYRSCIYSKKLVDLDQSIVKFFNVQVQGLGFLASLRTEVGVEKCSDKLDLILQNLKILNDEDPMSKDLDKLFEKVKAKVEALKAAATTNAGNIPFPDMSASTPHKASSLENTIENGEQDSLPGLPIISQTAQVTADTDPPLVCNSVHKLEDIKELSSCKSILKEYADKINVENPNYKTEKADGSKLAFISSLTFNGKQYVGEDGRSKKESQHLAAHVVIQSILDSEARDVISKIIKSKEKMICPAKPKVQNQCNTQNVCMPATLQTDNNGSTSSSKGNEIEVVVNDSMLKTATQEPCAGNSSGVSAKPVLLVEASATPTELSSCKAILKEYADKINVENPNYKTEKADGSHLAFVSSLTFGGKQYVGDKGRNKKESQHLAARAVILSILDSDAHDVISKIIKSKEKVFCSAKGTIHNPCSVQNVGVLVGIQTGCNNFGPSLSKGSELKLVVKDNMLKTASQDPYTGHLSTVTANPVSLVEASSTPTFFVPPNSEQLVCGSTSSKKRKRKTKKSEHKVGVDAQKWQRFCRKWQLVFSPFKSWFSN